MQYKLQIQDSVYHADATRLDKRGLIKIFLEGDERTVFVKSVFSNRINLIIDAQAVSIFGVRTDEGVWIWADGCARFVLDAQKAKRRKTRVLSEIPTEVTPPTPAAVTKVLVKLGDKVVKGQGLVVVSAMKMEITLSSPYSGIVRAVNTSAGEQVKPGDILIEIVPDAEASTDERT